MKSTIYRIKKTYSRANKSVNSTKRYGTMLFSILTVVVVSVFASSCSEQSKAEGLNHSDDGKRKVLDIRVQSVEEQSLSIPIHTSGKLFSESESKLSFKTGGLVESIFVAEGQRVHKGELLAKLNLSEIEARLQSAKLMLDKATRDLSRTERLYNEKVCTLEQYENVQTAYNQAKAQYRIGSFNYNHSTIKAPYDGVVLKKLVDNNEMVSPGRPVVVVAETSKSKILRVGVTDTDVMKLSLNDDANITFDAFPGVVFQAKVSEIGRSADIYTGTYEIELRLVSNNKKFVSGLIGSAEILPAVKHNYFKIPINAIVDGEGNRATIYTIDSGKTKKVEVTFDKISEEFLFVKHPFGKTIEVVVENGSKISNEVILNIERI